MSSQPAAREADERKVLFIHIPKTAGTSIKSFFKSRLDDFVVQANSAEQVARQDPLLVRVRDLADVRTILNAHRGLALHVDSTFDQVRRTTDFRSLAYLIFEPAHYSYFEQFTILTVFRHPFRRFLSEYAFLRRLRERDPGFLPDLDLSTAEAFFERAHPNAVLHFLLEPDLHKTRIIGPADIGRVKERIAGYPIHIGIHERLAESISQFATVVGAGFRLSDLPTLNAAPHALSVDPQLEAAFYERNRLDMELYDFAARLFETRIAS